MAINQNIDVYGREVPKAASYSSKAKGTKSYGLKFPFGELTEGTFLKTSSDLELIKSNLRQRLLTTRGERVMLPGFGTNLKNYLMEPLDQALLSQIRRDLLEAIYKYAPNVSVLKLLVTPIDTPTLNGGHALSINLFCALKEDQNLGFEMKVEIR